MAAIPPIREVSRPETNQFLVENFDFTIPTKNSADRVASEVAMKAIFSLNWKIGLNVYTNRGMNPIRTNDMNVADAPFTGLMFSCGILNSFFIIKSTQTSGFEVITFVALVKSFPLNPYNLRMSRTSSLS